MITENDIIVDKLSEEVFTRLDNMLIEELYEIHNELNVSTDIINQLKSAWIIKKEKQIENNQFKGNLK